MLATIREYEAMFDSKPLEKLAGVCCCLHTPNAHHDADFSVEFYKLWRANASNYKTWHTRAFDRGEAEAWWLKQKAQHPYAGGLTVRIVPRPCLNSPLRASAAC